jgi:hypothetical protein
VAENDVYRYRPQQHHCREGIAVENDRGVLIDTFWGLDSSLGLDQIVGRDQRLERLGNLDDYVRIGRSAEHPFEDYAPADRLVVPSQHGLQRALFVRRGAQPDHATRVANARRQLEDDVAAAESAQHRVERARAELARLEAAAAV